VKIFVEKEMVTSLAVAYQFRNQLILGPALVIILALGLFFLIKYPSARKEIGGILSFAGLMEMLGTLFLAFLWGFLIGLATLIFGIMLAISSWLIESKVRIRFPRATPAILLLIGVTGIAAAVATVSFILFTIGLTTLIAGVLIGTFKLTSRLKKASNRAAIGTALIAGGIAEIFLVAPQAFTWGFIIGLTILVSGIETGTTAFYPWAKTHLNTQKMLTLKKCAYAILAITICFSTVLIGVRSTTNLIHEQWLETYHGGNKPNVTFRGELTKFELNHEVNTGYSYHIFPAYLTLTVTGLLWGNESWLNQTSMSTYWQGKTATVYYERNEVPKITVGQQIEVSGYLQPWLEDSLYSDVLVVAPQIENSYLKLSPQ
jgi:hypothetical protein